MDVLRHGWERGAGVTAWWGGVGGGCGAAAGAVGAGFGWGVGCCSISLGKARASGCLVWCGHEQGLWHTL